MAKLTRDEVTVYIFAARYAMARQTFALRIVSDCIEKHINDFSDDDIKYLIEESQQAVDLRERFLDSPNTDEHKRLQRMCKTELERRDE